VFSENKVRVDQGVMTEANLTRKIWSMAKSNRESQNDEGSNLNSKKRDPLLFLNLP
jgi:hypothetical protein